MSRRLLAPAVLAAALVLAACGGSDSSGEGSSTPTPTASPTETATASPTAAEGWSVNDCAVPGTPVVEPEPPAGATVEGSVAVTAAGDAAPILAIAAGAPPAGELIVVDLVEGTGTAVEEGAEVTVNYCGAGLQTGAVFDSSWARGEPITFPLAGLIAGWQEGIPGMKPGGQRLLIIPGALAYGPAGSPPQILPDETLAFIVELVPAP